MAMMAAGRWRRAGNGAMVDRDGFTGVPARKHRDGDAVAAPPAEHPCHTPALACRAPATTLALSPFGPLGM